MAQAARRPRKGEEAKPKRRIGPQPGPQTAFLASKADIVIYGGAAGGGKTYALLLEAARYAVPLGDYRGIIFRRTTVQVRNPGGLWDESNTLYPLLGARGASSVLEWTFPSGATVKMAHLEHDKTRFEYQGMQVPFVGFDELTHFSAVQFFYMLSRLRSMSGVHGYVRATCNPDPDSWVAEFIAWWIDQETGLAIPERAGVVRWFVRISDRLHWADSREELIERFADLPPEDVMPMSVTFIPAKLSDNPLMSNRDPGYRAKLLALPLVERRQLLEGNWKIRPGAGLLFRREWVSFIPAIPAGVTGWVRGWDLAATPKTETNDPDWTAGTLIGDLGDRIVVAHHRRLRGTPGEVMRTIKGCAENDRRALHPEPVISLPKDPGQAGKWQVGAMVNELAGFTVRATPENGDKVTRFGPFSAQAEVGNVLVVDDANLPLEERWVEDWLRSLEGFDGTDACVCDDADSTSRAYNTLAMMRVTGGVAPGGPTRAVSPWLGGGGQPSAVGGGLTQGKFDE